MKLNNFIIIVTISISLLVSRSAQAADARESESTVSCKPNLSSQALSLIQKDIKNKFTALTTTVGSVKTSYQATPRLKISYSPASTKQKIKAKALLPNISIVAAPSSDAASVTVTGIGDITNICQPVTATIKISGSVKKIVTTTSSTGTQTQRTTLPLTGANIIITNVPTSFN